MTMTDETTDQYETGKWRLPSEIFSMVMEFLDYESVLSCSATCRSVLRESLPLLKVLHIDNSTQLNLKVAARFREIKSVHVSCLMSYDGDVDITVDPDTAVKLVPFLCKFGDVEAVYFHVAGLRNAAPCQYHFQSAWRDEGELEADKERMLAFLNSLSAASQIGALPGNLRIHGLCCPNIGSRDDDEDEGVDDSSECECCLKLCRNLPLPSVMQFESVQNSRDAAFSCHTFGTAVW